MRSWWKIMLGIALSCIGIGIVFGMIGIAIGRNRAISTRSNTFSFSDTVVGVESIDIDVKFSKVEIISGTEFSVVVNNMMEDGFKSYVKDGVWYLKDDYDDDNFINLFGFEIPITQGWFSWDFDIGDYAPFIQITMPDEFIAKEYNISLGAGELNMKVLNAINCDLLVGAGRIKLQRLNITNKAKLEVGAGELVVSNLKTQDAKINCGLGSVVITGEIQRDLTADCGMGSIELDLSGEEENYDYYINCGVGNVKLNRHNYDFIASDTIRNQNAVGSFKLNCGMGSIVVKIK